MFQEKFHCVVGQTQYFDVLLNSDGTFKWKGERCGEYQLAEKSDNWQAFLFAKNIDELPKVDLTSFDPAIESNMDDQRKSYMQRKIRMFVGFGGKVYPQ